MEIIIFET